ncbi:MAG: hypothetical protein UZ06_CHB003001394 [Chlorobi bacterium OLB6]|nr:MAG: hypothetical protein UZ06_CHB003001394 [Chlorobi bacterium OLB6]
MVRNLCCSVLIWVSLMLAGQVRAVSQEVRAAFDDSSTVWVITAQMQKSHWFLQADTAGFSEARLFKRSDGEYRLEISRVDSTGTLVTVNEVISEGAVRSVRARVTAVYHNKPSAVTGTGAGASGFGSESVASLDAGRTSLLVGSTFWGLAYGLYTTAALGADEYVGYGGLIGIGVGYMVPALLTRGRHVSVASSELALGGLFQGLGHGLLLTGTLFGDDPIDFRTPYALAVIVGLSEATAGYLIAAKPTCQPAMLRQLPHRHSQEVLRGPRLLVRCYRALEQTKRLTPVWHPESSWQHQPQESGLGRCLPRPITSHRPTLLPTP